MLKRFASSICLILLALLSSSPDLRCSAQPTIPDSELSALKAIAAKLKIGSDLWDFNLEPCNDWPKKDGKSTGDVAYNLTCTCNMTTSVCNVVSIMLKSLSLAGELPNEEFANLTHLSVIDLTRNYINGSIPPTWAKLPLSTINLIGNRVSGEIPKEIGDINTLHSLLLEDNLLVGSLPDSLGNMKNLLGLLLSANNFKGEIPASLAKLTNLTHFRIDGNGISGKFPSFIGDWKYLERLDMQGTLLEGPFPSTLSSLTKLKMLRISDFKGDGGFPPIENISTFKHLILRNCSISGPIPKFLGNLKNLEILDLSFNNFTGSIPPTLEALRGYSIKNMYLTDNRLNGEIPGWMFGNNIIDLSYNFFTGPEKERCQHNFVNLVSSFQSSQSNKTASCLRKNLPCSSKATYFELFIDCGGPGREINGTKYERDDHSLGASAFHKSTNENWAYSSTGDFVGDDKKYTVTNRSALKTSNSLYLSARISASSLKYYGLCLQSGSYTVKLHFAEIIFTDDQTYSSLGRRLFDVAIQGKNVLEDFNIAAMANGTGKEIVMSFNATVINTLEIGFRWSGKGTNAIPDRGIGVYGPLISAISVTPNFKPQTYTDKREDDNNGSSLSSGRIAGIVIGCLLAISLIIVTSFILLRKKERRNEELEKLKSLGNYYGLGTIKAATGNFDSKNKIGEGGFGPVYKGVLSNGYEVAVKQLSGQSRQGNQEFINEIAMISALQHPNLVKLYGCCIEGSQLLLIYEYLENNSLARALFAQGEQRINLDWQRRRQISLDIARGLAFLHEESRLKIVHRDIKATNILLDKDLNAKISDFGLAKLDDEEDTHISTRIAGTIGYMAPEYALHGHLTEKADVYSYGVVLLEIISGKSNTNYGTREGFVCLLDWAYVLKDQGRLLDLVDPSLESYCTTEAEQMLKLALLCTNAYPNHRPTMTSVVSMIEGEAPVPSPPNVVGREMRFQAFEMPPHESQLISSDGAAMESSVDHSSAGDSSTISRPLVDVRST